MRFPSIRKQQEYTVTVPQLCGGLNKSVPAHLIEDHQLSDVKNMWYKDGMLQTRPGVRVIGGTSGSATGGSYEHAQRVGDRILLYSFGQMSEVPFFDLALVDDTGDIINGSQTWHTWKQGDSTVYPTIVSLMAFPISTDANKEYADCEMILFVKLDTGAHYIFGYGLDTETELYGVRDLEPYVPTVIQKGRPVDANEESERGTIVEPYNLLTTQFACQYSTNGEGVRFNLPIQNLDPNFYYKTTYMNNDGKTYTHTVKPNSTATVLVEESAQGDGYQLAVNVEKGFFVFRKAGESVGTAVPLSNFANNVTIIARQKESSNIIENMTFSTFYGGSASGLNSGTRLFVSGNAERPNLVHWSALNNPLYFPENNYTYVGRDSKKVTAFGTQGELLVIFKDSEIYCTQYTQSDVTADDVMNGSVLDIEAAVAKFCMVQIHSEMGCDCPDTLRLCNNRLVWLNSDGRVYGLFTAGQYNERNVRALSDAIHVELAGQEKKLLLAASAAELESNYLLMVGSTVYVMDYSSYGFSYYSSYSSDEKAQKAITWYIWDLSNTGAFYRDTENAHYYTEPKLLQLGQRPLLVAEDPQHCVVTMTFKDEKKDCCFCETEDLNEEFTIGEKAIPCSFTTKLYNFNRPDLKKAIQQLYLSVRDDEDSVIRVSYLTERYVHEDAFTVTGEGEDGNGYIRTWRLTPNVNLAQAFGIRCDSETGMAVQGILLKYKYQGVVR